jgi:predicted nucleic acid-binding protein
MELGYGKRVPDVIASYKRNPRILNDITKTWDLIPRLFQIHCSILYETPQIVKNSLDISRDHQLLIKDAYIVSFAQDHQITHIASNDHDFTLVPWLTVWKPESPAE